VNPAESGLLGPEMSAAVTIEPVSGSGLLRHSVDARAAHPAGQPDRQGHEHHGQPREQPAPPSAEPNTTPRLAATAGQPSIRP